jgi:hypothetical protein
MIKFSFSPDIYRNYCPDDVINYQNILIRLSKCCHFNKKFILTLQKPIIPQDVWCFMQPMIDIPLYDYEFVFVYFEIPEKIRNYYKSEKIPYLNFMTPKLRFPGMEPCIMLESNLNLENIPIYLPELEVEFIHDSLEEYTDKVIAIGQMDMDRSTIFEGVPKNIFDYEFEADIFRPHPHALLHQSEFSEKMEILAEKKGLEVKSNGNIYQIITCAKKLISISSSTLYEAQYIGTPVQFLQEKDYIKQGILLKWKDITPSFWNLIGQKAKEFLRI